MMSDAAGLRVSHENPVQQPGLSYCHHQPSHSICSTCHTDYSSLTHSSHLYDCTIQGSFICQHAFGTIPYVQFYALNLHPRGYIKLTYKPAVTFLVFITHS